MRPLGEGLPGRCAVRELARDVALKSEDNGLRLQAMFRKILWVMWISFPSE